MSVTVSASATQTAVISTEHTLATTSTAGVYQLKVDCNAMVNGDIVEIRWKDKILSGGTERQNFCQSYAHVQADPHKQSIPMTVTQTATFTLTQTAGTGRNFPWELVKLA